MRDTTPASGKGASAQPRSATAPNSLRIICTPCQEIAHLLAAMGGGSATFKLATLRGLESARELVEWATEAGTYLASKTTAV